MSLSLQDRKDLELLAAGRAAAERYMLRIEQEPTDEVFYNHVRAEFVRAGTSLNAWFRQHDMDPREARTAIVANRNDSRSRNLKNLLATAARAGLREAERWIQDDRIDLNRFSTARNITQFRQYILWPPASEDVASYIKELEEQIRADEIDADAAVHMLAGFAASKRTRA